MTKIYCTTKLKEFINPRIAKEELSTNEIWSANLFYIDRRKCICFLNKETLYTVVIFDILKKDLDNLKVLFIESLITQLYSDCILKQTEESKTRNYFSEIHFYPTNNDKSTLGSLNDAVARIKYSDSIKEAKHYVSKQINRTPMSRLKFQFAKEAMKLKIREIIESK